VSILRGYVELNVFVEHLLVIVGHWLSGLHCMFCLMPVMVIWHNKRITMVTVWEAEAGMMKCV
jgi:hypothetical protein